LSISVVIFSGIVLVGFPALGRWFFKRNSDSITQYIFVLGLVFLASFLALLAGIEAIIGAFLAGLALNRLIPHTSPLMNRIEFVGNALFIPFFLIGVGMLIDYRVLFSSYNALLVALVMSLVATVSKYIAAVSTQKLFRFPKIRSDYFRVE
jgi:Kef-type K+ transport system membrane component KefB